MALHPDRTTYVVEAGGRKIHHLERKCPYYKKYKIQREHTVHSTVKMAGPGLICAMCYAKVNLTSIFKKLKNAR